MNLSPSGAHEVGKLFPAYSLVQSQSIAAHPSKASLIPTLVTRDDIADALRVDKRTLDRLRSAGKLPKPDLFIFRSSRWRPETIRAWIESGGGR